MATDKYDYECSNGQGWVKTLETPVWSPANTAEACWANNACESGVCVVTNDTDATLGSKVGRRRVSSLLLSCLACPLERLLLLARRVEI